jgi:hypothetical protein
LLAAVRIRINLAEMDEGRRRRDIMGKVCRDGFRSRIVGVVDDCCDSLSSAIRVSGQVGARCRRSGSFGHVDVQDEAPTDAEMPRPGVGKNGRSEVSVAFG